MAQEKDTPMPSSTDRSHVIRTSQQWESAIDKYSVIPWGVLCIELTPDGKTKAKVGEGNKFYSQLPYISNEIDLSNYYTKDEVDIIIENLEFMSIKETVPYDSRNALPRTGNKLGDVRFVKNLANPGDDPLMYIWNGTKWVFSGGSIIDIDLSEYAKKSEVYPRLQQLEALSHAHRNKNILDETSAVYTVEKDEKLASLKNYDVFVPATVTTDGEEGLVPAPLAGQQAKFLRGDGIWAKVKAGDKYRAGDGITILSGEVISDTFPFQVLPQAEQVTQYIIYGAPGGVGESVTGGYRIQINASAEGHTDRSVTAIIPDKLYEGDYVDYQKQVYSTYRTNVTSRVHADPNYNYDYGIYSDGRIAGKNPGAYSGYPRVTALFELEPGASYEITAYKSSDSWKFEDAMHINLYDADQNVTRTIAQSCTGNTTFTPAPTDKYMRFAYREDIWSWTSYERQKVWQLKDIERPCGLPELFLYPGIVNTINATTTVKPSLMYIEIEPPDDPESEDPMSEFTGIIYNDGVLDITQEDPNALNELTVHFRESDKVITIPGNTYTAGDGIDIDANDEISAKLGSGLQFDANGAIEVTGGGTGGNYGEGDAIKFEYEPIVPGDAVTHVKWSLLQTRGREAGTSDDCIQVREFEMRNIDNELISFKSNVTGVFVPSSTTPIYGSSETPDKLVDGTSAKMCCANFTSSITEFIFTMEPTTPVPMNRIKDYRYITAEDVPDRDPISWVLYVSTDGTNYIEVDRRIDQTITQSRSTATSYYTPAFPSTLSTTINVQYGDGLEVDNDNDLTVKLGTGLQFDTNGAIEAPGSRIYVDGDGIMITDNTSFELSEDTVTNTEYFFDTQVTSSVLGRIYTKYNTEPALGAVVYYESSYTQPFFVGLTADSVKYGTDWDSQIWPNPDYPTFEYKGVTWYYSGNAYGMHGDGTDASGHMQKLPGDYSVSTEADLQNIAKAIIDAADIITDPTKRISAKLGSGLQFDANGAIEVIGGGGGDSYVEGDGIEFINTTDVDMNFDYTAFVNSLTGAYNGTLSKNVDDSITITPSSASGSWTVPDISGASSSPYTFNVAPETTYKLTWDSGNNTVNGSARVFENAALTTMYVAPQSEHKLTFTTSNSCSYISIRFEETDSLPMTISNVKLFRLDPSSDVSINAKLGNGLSFDNNSAITVDEMTGATALANGASGTVPTPLVGDNVKFLRGDGSWAEIETSTKYTEGDAIEFGHPGMTDLGFDFDKFVSKFTEPNNGIVSVDSANKAFTLTATGSDCYTSPWTGGSLYTIPVIGGRKYRLTWDSNAPNVSGSIFAFENGDTAHMHSVNQSVQNYLEFTADTNSNVNFRFGVRNSGDSIRYSNIKFYEVDNADPDTNIINVKYGNGLSLDNNNALRVNVGDGLEIDANNNIKVDISRTTIFFNNNPNS